MTSVDTIHITVPKTNDFELKLDNERIILNSYESFLSRNGSLNGLFIKEYRDKIRIEFSSPKFLKGNNIIGLNNNELLESLIKIEKVTGLPVIEKGIIERIDVFKNISTKLKPKSYFTGLGELKFFTRSSFKRTTLYYIANNNSGKLTFYDKSLECKRNKVSIPDKYKNQNLLRVEAMFKKKRLKKIFKKELTIKMLIKQDALEILSSEFKMLYKSIKKESQLITEPFVLDSKKSLEKELMKQGIMRLGGILKVEKMIERSRNTASRPEYVSRRKREVRKLAEESTGIEILNIQELDNKIL